MGKGVNRSESQYDKKKLLYLYNSLLLVLCILSPSYHFQRYPGDLKTMKGELIKIINQNIMGDVIVLINNIFG